MKTNLLASRADYLGIAGSLLCLVHCVATPLLLLTSGWLRDPAWRLGFLSLDYVFIGLNVLAVYLASRHHASPSVKKALWSFLSLFTIALLLEEVRAAFAYLTYAASAGLIVTHLINLRNHRHTPGPVSHS